MIIAQLLTQFNKKIIGSDKVKTQIAETLLMLPEEIILYLSKNCWFMTSDPDSWGYAFNGNDLKDKHLIFLSDELFTQPKEQINHTILHEVGHIILKHKNSIGTKQSNDEITLQEQLADNFANQYLKDDN